MVVASWNVNSIKMRLSLVLDWLKIHAPDVLLLQELKCETNAFPFLEIESAGYYALVKGQKAYNGVAILSKKKAGLRIDHLPGDAGDEQARYIEADIDGFIIGDLYLPNGNPLGSEKFDYKIRWMQRLHTHAEKLLEEEKPVVLGGDYNVIPALRDAAHPEKWHGDALFQPESRAAYRALQNLGFVDSYRALHPQEKNAFTFWDYQAGAWPRDDGIRIDHLLLSPQASDRLTSCQIDRAPRGLGKASDHTPIVCVFD